VKQRRLAFQALVVVFGAAALYHVTAIFDPTMDPASPAWRHALFVGLNLACAAGFATRPPPFVPLFALLVVQQLLSHGADAWHAWHEGGRVDVTSFGVVVLMPFALVLLELDRRATRR
jgi:hypothetical protein